jgi:A nuclease family of the HNH/ENDO VII superfamily with conserved AHH
MGSKDHLANNFKGTHKQIAKSTENGGCLWGHGAGYRINSCCYRWQAHERAKTEKNCTEIYHRYKEVPRTSKITTSQYKTEKDGLFPAHYCAELDPPQSGDWDVTGPFRDIYRNKSLHIKTGKNFRKDTWPYWNNAHHLIPKGTLVATIEVETEKDPDIGVFIKKALMVGKYNVNHKKNMMFLPQDREVAQMLTLPRHLTLKHGDGPNGEIEPTDHKLYNEHVRQKLKLIIDDFKEKIKLEKHPNPKDIKLDKAKLENLSKTLFMTIKSLGSGKKLASAGKSLASLFHTRP